MDFRKYLTIEILEYDLTQGAKTYMFQRLANSATSLLSSIRIVLLSYMINSKTHLTNVLGCKYIRVVCIFQALTTVMKDSFS
jgi:hypothetical protein